MKNIIYSYLFSVKYFKNIFSGDNCKINKLFVIFICLKYAYRLLTNMHSLIFRSSHKQIPCSYELDN